MRAEEEEGDAAIGQLDGPPDANPGSDSDLFEEEAMVVVGGRHGAAVVINLTSEHDSSADEAAPPPKLPRRRLTSTPAHRKPRGPSQRLPGRRTREKDTSSPSPPPHPSRRRRKTTGPKPSEETEADKEGSSADMLMPPSPPLLGPSSPGPDKPGPSAGPSEDPAPAVRPSEEEQRPISSPGNIFAALQEDAGLTGAREDVEEEKTKADQEEVATEKEVAINTESRDFALELVLESDDCEDIPGPSDRKNSAPPPGLEEWSPGSGASESVPQPEESISIAASNAAGAKRTGGAEENVGQPDEGDDSEDEIQLVGLVRRPKKRNLPKQVVVKTEEPHPAALVSLHKAASAPSSRTIEARLQKDPKRCLASQSGPKALEGGLLERVDEEQLDISCFPGPEEAGQPSPPRVSDGTPSLSASSSQPVPGAASSAELLTAASQPPASDHSVSHPAASQAQLYALNPSGDVALPPMVPMTPAASEATAISLNNNVVVSVSEVADLSGYEIRYGADSFAPAGAQWDQPPPWDSGGWAELTEGAQMQAAALEAASSPADAALDPQLEFLAPEEVEEYMSFLTPAAAAHQPSSEPVTSRGKDDSMLEEAAGEGAAAKVQVHEITLVLRPDGSERTETAMAVLNMEQREALDPTTIVVAEDFLGDLHNFRDPFQTQRFLCDMIKDRMAKYGTNKDADSSSRPGGAEDGFPWHLIGDPEGEKAEESEEEREAAADPDWIPPGPDEQPTTSGSGEQRVHHDSSEEPPSLPRSPVKPAALPSSSSATAAASSPAPAAALALDEERPASGASSYWGDSVAEAEETRPSYALLQTRFDESERECRVFCRQWIETGEEFLLERLGARAKKPAEAHANCPPLPQPKLGKSRGRPPGSRNRRRFIVTSTGVRINRLPRSFRDGAASSDDEARPKPSQAQQPKKRGRPKGSKNRKTLLRLQLQGQPARSSVSWGGKGGHAAESHCPDLAPPSPGPCPAPWAPSGAFRGLGDEERPPFAIPAASEALGERLTSEDGDSDDAAAAPPDPVHPPAYSPVSSPEPPPPVSPKPPPVHSRLALLRAQMKKRKLRL